MAILACKAVGKWSVPKPSLASKVHVLTTRSCRMGGGGGGSLLAGTLMSRVMLDHWPLSACQLQVTLHMISIE